SVDDALEAVRLAQQIRAECLVMYTGARGGHTHNHARRLIRSALNEIGRAAAEHGVTLAIEPMHPGCSAEWTFLIGLDDTLELIDSLDSSPVKVVYDCYHLLQDGPITESLATIAPRIALLQLGD